MINLENTAGGNRYAALAINSPTRPCRAKQGIAVGGIVVPGLDLISTVPEGQEKTLGNAVSCYRINRLQGLSCFAYGEHDPSSRGIRRIVEGYPAAGGSDGILAP